jgi:hypothetical protein
MSAISGTRRSAKELADGTLRVMIDIDPRFKAEFHRLFPNIDMPCALAPLIAEFEHLPKEKPKGGPLCTLAARWCKDEDFRDWLGVDTEEEATIFMRSTCGIESRAQLDHDEHAALLFNEHFRIPYKNYLNEKE